MDHYYFSFSWARILPDGILANINLAGIDYYNRLINRLLQMGIEPVVAMFRWDLPQTIQNLGGFASEVIDRLF